MLTSSFFRRLFLPYLLLFGIAIAVVGIVGAQRLRSSYLDRTEQALHESSLLIAQLIAPDLANNRAADLQLRVRALAAAIGFRITVIAADGRVLADSEADPAAMENHRLRPEIVQAATTGEGSSVRASATVRDQLMYLARTVRSADGSTAYLRVAVHLRNLDRHLRAFYGSIALAAALVMLGAGAISYYITRRQAGPLVELTRFADDLRHGQLDRRILRKGKGEMATLANALDSMADSLSALIAQTARDKGQLLAVLSSMSEAVVATDTQQRILLCNAAAGTLLGLDADQARGRFLWEAVRHQPILQAASEVLGAGQRRSLRVGPIATRYLEVTARTFPITGAPEGLVIVAHDATESVRYQELRKEFVANVSHEMRTPLTAIRGFAETLRNGAMRDPERGSQYLATIEKHAEQLTNLVHDLLELSALESAPGLPRRVPVDLAQVIGKVADLLGPAAQLKHQNLCTRPAPDLPTVPGDPDYLERAIANLVENAIKYTPEGGSISVSGTADATHAAIRVTDSGIGIPAADLPRIFERFYRVDRSRSREMGGTGLGLSIVKHIAQAHRGTIEVTSTPGAGSTFTLRLPLSMPQ